MIFDTDKESPCLICLEGILKKIIEHNVTLVNIVQDLYRLS
jgi:hypothetical protein